MKRTETLIDYNLNMCKLFAILTAKKSYLTIPDLVKDRNNLQARLSYEEKMCTGQFHPKF